VVEGRRRITAVICTNDVLAIGALFECRALGVAVPQALSVTGFDDLDLAMHMDPGLTTVHVPAGEIGRRAADLVLARIDRTEVPERVELAANLILRASTGRPPS
jgi:LacI family transcriptional regulator